MDGIYSITFRGFADWGMGMLLLQHGSVIGSDSAGVLYDGQYFDEGKEVLVRMKMTVPPGVTLVQGTEARPKSYEIPVEARILREAFESGAPVLLHLPPGPVNVIFRRLRSLD